MNKKPGLLSIFIPAVAMCFGSTARAQSLDVTLTDADPVVTQGTASVAFDATITNMTGSTIFLNGDNPTTGSPFLTVNDNPFFANAPISLAPGATSGSFEMFDVNISPSALPGTYNNNVFSILGGALSSSVNDVADAMYSVTVASAPEIDSTSAPAALTLLFGLIAVYAGRRRPLGTKPGSAARRRSGST
jgi:hypothetical protein